MTIAFPVSQGRLASHFSKAEWIDFYGEDRALLAHCGNPALANDSCGGKNELLALLMEHSIKQIVVRNIGQRMLGKIIESGACVLQAGSSDIALILALLNDNSSEIQQLTESGQGRPSHNYAKHRHDGDKGEHHCENEKHSCQGDNMNDSGSHTSCCKKGQASGEHSHICPKHKAYQ